MLLPFNASINKAHANSSKDFNVDRPYVGTLGTYRCEPNYMLLAISDGAEYILKIVQHIETKWFFKE
jgi:hypothetical protein